MCRCSTCHLQPVWVAGSNTNRSNRHIFHHIFKAASKVTPGEAVSWLLPSISVVGELVGAMRTLCWTQKPWERPHQCLRTRANTSWHCRSQPYFEQSQWYRVPLPGPDPQVRSLSWPLEQILCVGVVVAISNLSGWQAATPTGQIVPQTVPRSLTFQKSHQERQYHGCCHQSQLLGRQQDHCTLLDTKTLGEASPVPHQ